MRQILALLVTLLLVRTGAALEPADVFVIYNSKMPESKTVAEYYAAKRKVPAQNLIPLELSTDERISRDEYVRTVAEPAKAFLSAGNRLKRVKCLLTVYGVPLAVNSVPAPAEEAAYKEARKRLDEAEAALKPRRERLAELEKDKEANAEAISALKKEMEGPQSELKTLEEREKKAKESLDLRHETRAALDSELALIFWKPYELVRWQPNLLHDALRGRVVIPPGVTLMTCRLDGPTPESVRKMIDASVEVEEKGLSGTAYFDARGMRSVGPKPSAYAVYDEAIRQTAAMAEGHGVKTLLNNREALFGQEGQQRCPDAMLYCGWYSLGKYIGAFDWVPGAVGYHVASAEAVSLRKGDYWCKRMIDDGISATLGPVNEPYLQSFPDPRAFFGLLLTGKYPLAEVYWRTTPYASWVMTLVGDPLYNPFKKDPHMTEEEVAQVVAKALAEQPRKPGEVRDEPAPK